METGSRYSDLRWLTVSLAVVVLSSGCATAPLRFKADDGEVFEVQPRAIARVELSEAVFEAAMSSLYAQWELPAPTMQRPRQVQLATWERSSWLSQLATEVAAPSPLEAPNGNQDDLARGYRVLCERRGEPGDCLGLFEDGRFFSVTDKRTIATRIALSEAFTVTAESLRGVTAHQVEVAVLAGLVLYMGLLAVPEPVSKVVVIVFAANLIASIGVDLFLSFIQGYRELKKDSEAAETFADLHDAGERYGRLIGPAGARLMVVLVGMGAGGALGAASGGFPGGATVASNAEAQGFLLSASGTLTSVQVAGSSVLFGVGAGAAVAPWVLREKGEDVTDKRPRGFKSYSSFKRVRGSAGAGQEWHHIVEQTDGNITRFGVERIHHDNNMLKLDVELHRKISAFYSSKQPVSGNAVVRDWLRSQSFEAQRAFGLKTIRDFGATR